MGPVTLPQNLPLKVPLQRKSKVSFSTNWKLGVYYANEGNTTHPLSFPYAVAMKDHQISYSKLLHQTLYIRGGFANHHL